MNNFVCCPSCFAELNDMLEDAGNIWIDICGIKHKGFEYIRVIPEADGNPLLNIIEENAGIITTERDDGICIRIITEAYVELGTTIYCLHRGKHGRTKDLHQVQESEDKAP